MTSVNPITFALTFSLSENKIIELMKTHRFKILTLIALSMAFFGYSATLYLDEAPEINPANYLAQEGKILYQNKNCTSCHQLYGLGGHLGPDLTNVSGKRSVAYIEAFLRNGTKVMPNFNLTQNEIEALTAFLEYTNTTGQADPTTFTKNIDGTITKP